MTPIKHPFTASVFLATLLLLSSCLKDHKNNFDGEESLAADHEGSLLDHHLGALQTPIAITTKAITTKAGEQVTFFQKAGQWWATVERTLSAGSVPTETMLVRSKTDIGKALAALSQHDAAGQARRVQVIRPAEGEDFVYVGAVGLAGGHNMGAAFNTLLNNISNNRVQGALNLSRKSLTDTDVASLAQALAANQSLTRLDLYNNQIGDAGAASLAQALAANQSLTTLLLYNNQIGAAGAASLAQALAANKSLAELSLSNNQIGAAGAASLAQALARNQSLTKLWLYNNQIGAAGAASLAQALERNQSLTLLSLWDNQIGAAGAASLAEMLEARYNTTLTSISLEGNNISGPVVARIKACLKRNEDWTAEERVANRRIAIRVVAPRVQQEAPTTTTGIAGDITNGLDLNTGGSATLPSSEELQKGITQLETEMEKVRQQMAELQKQGSEMKEATRQELEEFKKELQRLDKEKASRQELKDLQEALESTLPAVQDFMEKHKKRLSKLFKDAQDKDFANKELAKALSGRDAQEYADNLVLGLHRFYLTAMIGTSGHFTGKGNGYLSKVATATAFIGKLFPVGSNYTDIIAGLITELDAHLLKKAFENIIKLANSLAEMDQIADGVMRELSLSNTGELTRRLCDQHLRRIMEAAYRGELKGIDHSGSGKNKIRRVVRVLSNIAEGKDIGKVRRPALPKGKTVINRDLQDTFPDKNVDTQITPGELRAKEKEFRKPKGAREKSLARKASGVFRVIDEVIFPNVKLEAMKKASLKLAVKAALKEKSLSAPKFSKAFLSEEEATQHKVWRILKQEVEEAASKITKDSAADIKELAREAVSNLAAALEA